jgi:putative ABC transport system permease protein
MINIELMPIVSALKRNKAGAILMVLQIALMVTFINNLVAIIGDRISLISRPTGIDEENIFAIGFRLTSGEESVSVLQAELAKLRALPGVVEAVATNSYPLRGSGWQEGVSHSAGPTSRQDQSAQTAVYAMDQHAIGAFGLRLVEGRNFSSEEIIEGHFDAAPIPSFAIITRSLQNQLFPTGDALGKVIYLTTEPRKPVSIIGVVDRLQSPVAAETIDSVDSDNSIILPIHAARPGGLLVIRAKPGSIKTTLHEVQSALVRANPSRIFGRFRPFTEVRRTAYEKDRSIAIAFGILLAVLVVITALAIVGLTSFWVVRRRTQIGIRRALGATRVAIIRYFLIENAVLCISGVLVGIIASVSLNVWLWVHFGIDRIESSELLVCAIVVVAVGQLASMVPAMRAARTSPAEALRSH